MSQRFDHKENGAIISHYDEKKFNDFVEKVNATEFPVPISEFREMLGLLSQYTYVWYTYSFNPFWLKQVPYFMSRIPATAYMVYREKNMRILPNIFSHPMTFVITTTAESRCVLAISDET